ncbi:nucleotidyltransferase domain-containing protein [Desulfobacterales bacterium HSG2]|nr:nucleotidyltransferase domain-containing protein [Desulfobacterales bacterium HSG2]
MDMDTLIKDINSTLKSRFQDYAGVYFFGSRSRGDYREYSDYDMVFVFRTKPDWQKKDQIRDIVYRKEVEYDLVIDGKYYSQEDVKNYKTPFLESVFKKGKFYAV